MTRDTVIEKVYGAIAALLCVDVETLSLENKFYNDLGCDDLDEVELAMECEGIFEIEITDEEMSGIMDEDIESLVTLILEKKRWQWIYLHELKLN